jgi:positive phototaxis protein PixI
MGQELLTKPKDFTDEQERDRGQQFLQFKLLPDTNVLLPLAQMVEVLSLPVMQVVAIPDLPEWIMGIYNWQGQILWLLDLGSLIGLPPIYGQTTNYTVVVINESTTGMELGLLVQRVEDIEWVDPDLIESPPESETRVELLPFLRGFLFNVREELMVVLDCDAIFAAMPQSQIVPEDRTAQ